MCGRALLPEIGSSSSHSLDTGPYYLLQAFDEVLRVESESLLKNEWRHNVTIACDHTKHYVDRVFGFLSISIHLVGIEPGNSCSVRGNICLQIMHQVYTMISTTRCSVFLRRFGSKCMSPRKTDKAKKRKVHEPETGPQGDKCSSSRQVHKAISARARDRSTRRNGENCTSPRPAHKVISAPALERQIGRKVHEPKTGPQGEKTKSARAKKLKRKKS